MDYEIKILKDILEVKKVLKNESNYYQEDFLLENIVFISIDDLSKLKPIMSFIEIKDEEYATNNKI